MNQWGHLVFPCGSPTMLEKRETSPTRTMYTDIIVDREMRAVRAWSVYTGQVLVACRTLSGYDQ